MPFDREAYMRRLSEEILQDCCLEQRVAELALEVLRFDTSPEQFLRWLRPEERLQGLTPEQRLEGMTPDERVELRRLLDDPESAGFAHSVFVATT